METTPTPFQETGIPMGSYDDRRFCITGENTNKKILEPPSRPGSRGYRCFQLAMEPSRLISSHTMATDFESDSQTDDRREGSTGNVDYTKLAHSILVADGTASVNNHNTNYIEDLQKMESNRMALIRKNQNQDFNAEITKYLEKAKSNTTTQKHYDQLWKQQWASWCHQQNYSAVEYNPSRVLEYLWQRKADAYSTLNTIRSAIASVFRVIHSKKKPPLASNQSIIDFFKAKQRHSPKLPNSHQETFDIQVITDDRILSWGPTFSLPLLDKLQIKALYLLTVTTM
ncbi:hypothetical protein G6F42_023192 [Rhizopus arrhizus]|nr:hypothetical protein G6F42_023192 [Rhizopus arrhizus]